MNEAILLQAVELLPLFHRIESSHGTMQFCIEAVSNAVRKIVGLNHIY